MSKLGEVVNKHEIADEFWAVLDEEMKHHGDTEAAWSAIRAVINKISATELMDIIVEKNTRPR